MLCFIGELFNGFGLFVLSLMVVVCAVRLLWFDFGVYALLVDLYFRIVVGVWLVYFVSDCFGYVCVVVCLLGVYYYVVFIMVALFGILVRVYQ